ncbi:hypothetical protein [Tabrizicola sp.]|uniref:hypothetical protein n=1 Tax=Tabrizicola sp. TaxID=2005166 RepID=UPI003F390AA7
MPIVPDGALGPPHAIDFAWDEPNYLSHFYFLPADTHDRLLSLTKNANFALAIGSAEWIRARFAPFDADRQMRDYLAAAWADMAPGWRCAYFFPPDDDWRGPVRGPMVAAMTILNDAMSGRGDNPEQADRAVWMHNLAMHVVKPSVPYTAWWEAMVARLEQTHSWTVEGPPVVDIFADRFPQGDSVSPEALMQDVVYDPAQALRQLERFVERERRDGNPFVLDETEMG